MSDSSKQPSEPTREQLEAHVVAMLQGETSSFEEAQLQQQIRDDERLAKFCSEIEKTLSLVSDAFDSGQSGKANRANVRLSRQRRSMLKKTFGEGPRFAKHNIASPDFRRALWAIAAVLALFFVVFGVIFPSLSGGKVGTGQLASVKTTAEDQSVVHAANTAPSVSENQTVTVTASTEPIPAPTPEPALQPMTESNLMAEGGEPDPALSRSSNGTAPSGFALGLPAGGDEALGSEGDWLRTSGRGERAEASGAIRQFANLEMPYNHGDSNPADKAEPLFDKQGQLLNQRGVTQRFGFGVETAAREKSTDGPVEMFQPMNLSGPAANPFAEREKLQATTGGLPAPVGGGGGRIGGGIAFGSAMPQGEVVNSASHSGFATGGVSMSAEGIIISGETSKKDSHGWYYQAGDSNRPGEAPAAGRAPTTWDSESGIDLGRDQWNNFSGQQQRGGNSVDATDAKPMGMMGGFGGGGFSGGKYSGITKPGAAEVFWGDEGGGAATGDPVVTTAPAPVQPTVRRPQSSTPRSKAKNTTAMPSEPTANIEAGGRLNWSGTAANKEVPQMSLKLEESAKSRATRYDLGTAADKEADYADSQPISQLKADLKSNLALDDYARKPSDENEEIEEEGQAEVPMLGDLPINGRMFRANRELADETKNISKGGQGVTVLGRSSSSTRRTLDLAGENETVLEELDALVTTRDALRRVEGRLSELRESVESGKDSAMPEAKKPANLAKRLAKPKPDSDKKLREMNRSLLEREKILEQHNAKLEAKRDVDLTSEEPPSRAKPVEPSVVYTPKPETVTAENAFSTFSLNVSDVSFKTAFASLQSNKLPQPSDVRSEEFLNALEYRDPMPRAGEPVAFNWERARSPFTHDRDIIRFSVKTAALGRQPGRAVNLVCLLDNSGSMEREDRERIVTQALTVLARKLTPNDRVSLITFSRTPSVRIDGMRGGQGQAFLNASTGWRPQGGTHIENALAQAYKTARKHFVKGGNNRVILLTDGAANMGNVDPYKLRETVEANRKQGIALDCFGIGWEGYNDNLLEVLARNGDGRYGFLNQPSQVVDEFEKKLLGAFQVAASDVKVQVEWNEKRVRVYRQVGYLRHQLKKEDFRNNKVDAAEISAAESGNAMYVVQVDEGGEGPLGVVRVRYKKPFTREYTELEWSLAYEEAALPLEQSSPAMKLASVSATFAEWLARNPYSEGVQLADLQGLMAGLASVYGTDPRPAQLEEMIRKARILDGN